MSPFYGVHAAEGIEPLDHALFRRNPEFANGAAMRHLDRVAMGFEPVSLRSGLVPAPQPLVDGGSSMVVFDGRIDNADELCPLLDLAPTEGAEAEMVRAAFAAWGEGCFSRLLGDWALAFWCGSRRTLYLARDHAGARCLYFARSGSGILWSSRLRDLLACPAPRDPDESFAACYLAGLPPRNLTPFAGVRSVPPGHFLAYDGKTLALREHWSPRARDLILYRTDSEYEEHFLDLFERSVMRRSRTGGPILAELSGGMDSSSIVCVDDRWRRREGATVAELLDTVSYFDEEEPGWDERRYFTCVERARGKKGVHLPLPLLSADLEPPPVFYDRPGGDRAAFENEKRLQEAVGDRGYRVLLSGIGGDELLGGVPTPYPELADLGARGRVGTLGRQSVAWSLCLRKPIVRLAAETATWTIGQYLHRPSLRDLPPWATDKLGARARGADATPPVSMRIADLGPRSIHRQRTWWAILETLPHLRSRSLMALEYRYP